ncbi:hypothetical protein V1525DRAFT_404824 [Lipomyces kononenkoae]|uniref:Uncharacterized protein n=1 Tax=Lipomyces kononenkoae TaxID=34357 RepID=A0ACC3T0M3_LIPKO
MESDRYPQLWYDSKRQIAVVVAAGVPLQSDMAGELLDSIIRDVRPEFSSNITSGLRLSLPRGRQLGTLVTAAQGEAGISQ